MMVERYGVFEIKIKGRKDGNPFVDYEVNGHFRSKSEEKEVKGFYDGEGTYIVRFMPSFVEEYTYVIEGNHSGETHEGKFKVTEASEENHGPVRVAGKHHFAYEDGKPYYCMGTTCYAWALQPEALRKETLETLKEGPFNKIRFCIFPKHYLFNLKEPERYPYEGSPADFSQMNEENFEEYTYQKHCKWDFTRFNPEYFRNIEEQISALCKLGIEADLIIMHPYDRWGFSDMGKEADELYYKYIIARFAAYRNVWWSLANEYDFVKTKALRDWERYAGLLIKHDPYSRLRSIHNGWKRYDWTRPWVTHCSVQRNDTYKTVEETNEWREIYKKPIVIDELVYEGNIHMDWGNVTGEEIVRRFWETVMRGGYPGHGETFVHKDNVLWWSHGGKLHGESVKRIAFLKGILEETPGHGLRYMPEGAGPYGVTGGGVFAQAEIDGEEAPSYILAYYGFSRSLKKGFYIDDTTKYRVEVVDTWNMVIEDRGTFQGRTYLDLPDRQYMAMRLRKE